MYKYISILVHDKHGLILLLDSPPEDMLGCLDKHDVPCSLLDAELVQEALNELTRLMPNSDPKQTLLRNPSYVTKVERGPKRLGPHPDS